MSSNGRGLGPSIRTEGGLLPADLLARVASNDPQVPGLTLAAYHLEERLRFGEAITRSWNRLIGSWATFQAERAALPSGDVGTTVTRERWLLPLFDELGYGRLQRATAVEVDNKTYPISHAWNTSPIHLIGCRVALDRRTERVAGAAGQAPHGLVQELLNRSPERLWGFVTNGLTLRILRDNATLTRQAYVEFDLEAIFDGEAYADFALLWLVAHQSRVEGEKPEECWLEKWTTFAAEAGTRALDKLRAGVETAISALGSGFLGHSANGELRDALRAGVLDKQDYYRELLRLVYRLLFLFTAEDRGLLLDPGADEPTRRRYLDYYSTARLRHLAERRKGSRHADLWAGLKVVLTALGSDSGAPGLGLPALGGFLFSDDACPRLDHSTLANRDLLDAVRALATIEDGRVRRSVDYRNLGAEELGGVYESLLELHPELDANAGTFALTTAGGHERKTTGSYYTPTVLINVLLDSALDPVLAEAVSQDDPEAAILGLTVVDPAAGSGHFLVAAAHRIAKRLAAARTGDEEPSPAVTRTALRDVIGHCIYAVDVNPMAVELCKVSLWLEAIDPGKPLSFLDAHIKCGNSLLGTTPELLGAGIPDGAYAPVTGDSVSVARDQRNRNVAERQGQRSLMEGGLGLPTIALAEAAVEVDRLGEEDAASLRFKAERYGALVDSRDYRRAKLAADAWCAAFVAPKKPGASEITTATVRQFVESPGAVPGEVQPAVRSLADDYGFLHWPIEFPVVFAKGGFDCVLGNPPWERLRLEEQQYFAERNPEIADASGSRRKRLIAALEITDPDMFEAFGRALRRVEAEGNLLRNSGRFPLAARGVINTYSVFSEASASMVGPSGRVGLIVPTGIATDDTTKFLFADWVSQRRLASLFDFINDRGYFPGVGHGRQRFCLLSLCGVDRPVAQSRLCFFAHTPADLMESDRIFTLSPEDFNLMNPNTGTCPTFRSGRDADLTRATYARIPVMLDETRSDGNPWSASFLQMFSMSDESGVFRDSPGSSGVPLYEAKMFHQFIHRYGDYAFRREGSRDSELPTPGASMLRDPAYGVRPRYWVERAEVERRLGGRPWNGWLLGWRDICRSTDERTVIAAALPPVAVGNSTYLLATPASEAPFLLANLNSFVLDWVARQKLGGTHLNLFVAKQLPILPPRAYRSATSWSVVPLGGWLAPYLAELVYTSWDLLSFGEAVGWVGPPFAWDDQRRVVLRAEVDAAFFHLYGLSRPQVDDVLESFPIVRRNEERDHGEFLSKRLVLETFDAMANATAQEEFVSRLVPGPGDPAVAHPSRSGDAMGRWIPWPDVESLASPGSEPTQTRRPTRRRPSPWPAPVVSLPERPNQPDVGYPETPPAWRRAAEEVAPARAATQQPSQTTLSDLTRAATTPEGWIPEEAVDVGTLMPGCHVRHRRFGDGVVIDIRRAAKPPTVTIRFGASDDREIAIGYGLLEFEYR